MESKEQINGLLKKILAKNNIQNSQVEQYEKNALKEEKSFFHYILDNKIIEINEYLDTVKEYSSEEYFDLSTKNSSSVPSIPDLTVDFFTEYDFIPVFFNDVKIVVVTSNPFNQNLTKELRNLIQINNITVKYGNYFDIKRIIKELTDANFGISDFDESELDDISISTGNPDPEPEQNPENDAPVVKFINKMLYDAIKMKASDLHFEPYEKSARVRFRIDGVLKTVSTPNITVKNQIAARLKVLSGMDIAEKRKPQDGRIKIKFEKNDIDFRVNTLPTLYGEKIVLRILDPSSAQMGIDSLGYEPDQKALYLEALNKPQGMILVTGPTGSGKTVSLYTGLNILNTENVNISTAEDPVEINLEGINQVNINNKAGLNFSTALRSFLRQDPDIIMVGEIRDLETAEIAIKAAQTGHMVMSTLHTNSAAETLTRLKNMGVPSYNIASSVNLIIAQRLVRRLCPKCKKKLDLPEKILKETGFTDEDIKEGFQLYSANTDGCEHCSNGFKGRCGVYEVVKIDKAFSELIFNDADSMAMSNAFREAGYDDLRRSALLKVKAGLTTLEEVSRVTIE